MPDELKDPSERSEDRDFRRHMGETDEESLIENGTPYQTEEDEIDE